MLHPFGAVRQRVMSTALALLTACSAAPAQPSTPPVAGVTGVPQRVTPSPYPAPPRITPDRRDAAPYPAVSAPPSTLTVRQLPPTQTATPLPTPVPTPTPPVAPTPLPLPASSVQIVDRLPLDRPWVSRTDTGCTVQPHPDRSPLAGQILGAIAADGTVEEWPTPVITILRPHAAPPILLTCAADQQLRFLTTATWASSPPLTSPRPGSFRMYAVNAAGTEGIAIGGMEWSALVVYRVDLRSGVFTPIRDPFVLPLDEGIESITWMTDTLHVVMNDGRAHFGYAQIDATAGTDHTGSLAVGGNALILSPRATWAVYRSLGGGSSLANLTTGRQEDFGPHYRMYHLAFTADETLLAATGTYANHRPPPFFAIFDLTAPISSPPIRPALPPDWPQEQAGKLTWTSDQHLILERQINDSFRTLVLSRTGQLERELPPLASNAVHGTSMMGSDNRLYRLFQEQDRLVLRQARSDGRIDHIGLPAGRTDYELVVVP